MIRLIALIALFPTAILAQSIPNPARTGTSITGVPNSVLSPADILNAFGAKADYSGLVAAQSAITNLLAGGVSIKSAGAVCNGATDDTAAINAVLSANRVVTIPTGTGTCMVSGPLNITLDHSVLAGPGLDSATFKSTSTTASVIKVAMGLTQVTLAGFSIDRTVTPVAGANGIDYTTGGINAVIANIQSQHSWYGFALGGISYGQLTSTISVNNYADGVYQTNSAGFGTSQWTMLNTISQGNDGWGYNVVSTSAGGQLVVLPMVNATSFGNTLGGAAFHGRSDAPIYDVTIMGGIYSSDNGDELFFDTYGGQIKVAGGTFCELAGTISTGRGLLTPATHVGNGIHSSGAVGDIQVTGAFVSANSQNGALIGALRSTFVGNVFMQNSQVTPNAYRGIDFQNVTTGSTVLAVGNRVGNLNNTTPQGIGIAVANGSGAALIGNDLTYSGVAGLAVGTNATSLTTHGNLGFVDNASGVGNIPSGTTSVVVTHGLTIAPTQVFITPSTFQGTGAIWVDTITSTTFTVHISASYTSLIGFSWAAKVFNT